jgi:hypothetical protein
MVSSLIAVGREQPCFLPFARAAVEGLIAHEPRLTIVMAT